MKEKCDNNCVTCPLAGQVYCSLMFAKSNNEVIKEIDERIQKLEEQVYESCVDIKQLQDSVSQSRDELTELGISLGSSSTPTLLLSEKLGPKKGI